MEKTILALPDDDYAQSANVLFHFMSKLEYLEEILLKHALVPRYCMENLEYLNLKAGDISFPEVLILQKCFCDIPFHKLMELFKLEIVKDAMPPLTPAERVSLTKKNTHPDCYGQYAIAFSKKWGEQNKLQPIQYINGTSGLSTSYSELFSKLWETDDLPDEFANDMLMRLSFMKPLRGIMDRRFERENGENAVIQIYKNFHDEKEWRYVPSQDTLAAANLESVIANPYVLSLGEFQRNTNDGLTSEAYKELWLDFQYDDIRYIIVPDSNKRVEIINFILNLPDEQFVDAEKPSQSKYVLISKILVLDEIRKDW